MASKVIPCPECAKPIDWPINNPAGPFCRECGGLISVVYPNTTNDEHPAFNNKVIDAIMMTNDPQGEYMSKAEANAMDRIRSVAKEAASKAAEMMIAWASVSERVVGNENILLSIKEHTDAHDKATEQAKRKEFEAIERNEYDEIMNAQEDADEAKYGEQPKRGPMLSDDIREFLRANPTEEPPVTKAIHWTMIEKYVQAKIDSGELMVVKTVRINVDPDTDGTSYDCLTCLVSWRPNSGTSTNYCPGCGGKIVNE